MRCQCGDENRTGPVCGAWRTHPASSPVPSPLKARENAARFLTGWGFSPKVTQLSSLSVLWFTARGTFVSERCFIITRGSNPPRTSLNAVCASRPLSASLGKGGTAVPGSEPPLRPLSPGKRPERAALRCPPPCPGPRQPCQPMPRPCQCPASPASAPAPLGIAPTPAALPHNSPRRCGAPARAQVRSAARERKGRGRRAVRHLPRPLGGRRGRGAAPGAGSGGAVGRGPGPARPCPRCPEVEMQKSRLSGRDVDFLAVVFSLALPVSPRRRSAGLGAGSAGGRDSVPGHGDPRGFGAGPEVPRSEEWVSGPEPQEGSSAVKRGGAPCAAICRRRGSLIDFARVPTSCKNTLRVRSRGESELMTNGLAISVVRRARGRMAAERMAGWSP